MTEPHPDQEPTSRPTLTLLGNAYDLASLVALITGAVLLSFLLTCGISGYCLPLVPIFAGLIGLTSAARAADPARTRLYSWLGIGAGGLYLLFMLALFALYVTILLIGAFLAAR